MNAPHTPPAPFVLPSAVAALTSRLPAFPGSVLLVTALGPATAGAATAPRTPAVTRFNPR